MGNSDRIGVLAKWAQGSSTGTQSEMAKLGIPHAYVDEFLQWGSEGRQEGARISLARKRAADNMKNRKNECDTEDEKGKAATQQWTAKMEVSFFAPVFKKWTKCHVTKVDVAKARIQISWDEGTWISAQEAIQVLRKGWDAFEPRPISTGRTGKPEKELGAQSLSKMEQGKGDKCNSSAAPETPSPKKRWRVY